MSLPSPERLRVAQKLHDGIAQDLVGVGYSLDLLLSDESLSNRARSDVRSTRLAIDVLITKVRTEILQLRRDSSLPLHSAIRRIAEDLLPSIQLDLQLEEVLLEAAVHEVIISVTNEILRNCATHSGATHIGIKLYPVHNRTCLEIFDNGIGGAQVKDGRFGIVGIVEQIQALNGTINIQSIKGTRITILI